MYLSSIDTKLDAAVHSELAGCRVLLTGLSPRAGIDIARAFAAHNARMIVQCDDASPETDAMAEVISPSLADIRLFTGRLGEVEAPVPFTQKAAQAFGGLDIVVNLIGLDAADIEDCVTVAQFEDLVSRKLNAPALITRVAANRMRLMLGEGLIVNVIRLPELHTDSGRALAAMFRAAVATLTRHEAQEWAGQAIRINALAPRSPLDATAGASLDSEPDMAALILHLAGKRGRNLSGLVFDIGA